MSANTPLYFVRNVEHRKQSGTRPFRIAALLGTLLRATSLRPRGMKRFSKTFVISAVLSVAMLACADPVTAQKPYPAGIIDLPPSIDALHPIGELSDHALLDPIVDGVRIRTGWDNSEPSDEFITGRRLMNVW